MFSGHFSWISPCMSSMFALKLPAADLSRGANKLRSTAGGGCQFGATVGGAKGS